MAFVTNKESGKIARRRFLPNINASTTEVITKSVVHFSMNSIQNNWQQAVSEAVTKRTIKPMKKGLLYTQQVLLDKRKKSISSEKEIRKYNKSCKLRV